MRFVLLLAGMIGAAAAEGLDTAKLAGYYRGSIHVRDNQDPQHKNWRYDVVLELKLDGTNLVGACQYLGGPRVPLRWTASKPGWYPIELEEVGRPVVWWANASVGNELSGTWRGLPGSPAGNFHLERDDSAQGYFDRAPGSSSADEIEYRIEQVPGTDHLLPRITRFRDRKVLAAVNRRLAELARKGDCDPVQDRSLESEVGYAAHDVFSVRIMETCSEFPAALAPDDRSLTFDLKTGEEVDFLALFKEGVSDAKVAAVAFAYEIESRARAYADPCLEKYSGSNLSLPTFSFSDDGLVVRPSFGVTGNACADDVTVPYPVLAPFAAEGGVLGRVAAAHKDAPRRYRIHRPATLASEDVFYTAKD